MNFKNIFITIVCLTLISCANSSEIKNNSPKIEGFWNRLGTIQLVNGIHVDTSYIKDSEDPSFKQLKVFKDGNMIWLNNYKDTLSPWKGGSGGYGKYKINSKDSITERISHGTGRWGAMVKNYKDSLNLSAWTFGLETNINENFYSQKNSPNSKFAEYWERMPRLESNTKIDGAWKRVYQINYVNGIAVDTVSVPNDAVLDVKVMSRGNYTYQVDLTGISDPEEPQYGGFGGFGTFEYDSDKMVLVEYQEWGFGTSTGSAAPKTNPVYHDIKFYNDDLFIQIGKDTLGATSNQAGRGLVYKRIK